MIGIDAAAGFDWVERLSQSGTALSIPVMVSLHATKLATSLEGGMVVWNNTPAIRSMIAWGNFGIDGAEPISQIGCNAKMSEAHAAYGLASMAIWPEVRDRMLDIAARYVELFERRTNRVSFAPNILSGLATSTFNILSSHLPENPIGALGELGIETRRWWRSGVHQLPAYASFLRAPMTNTEQLAQGYLGLPFSFENSPKSQELVVDAVVSTLRP